MEDKYKKRIQANLFDLIRNTNCNSLFLAVLVNQDIISSADVDYLDSLKANFDRSAKFYEIIVTRTKSFNHLLCALNKTAQSGAIELLIGEDRDHPRTTNHGISAKSKRTFTCSIDGCSPNKRTSQSEDIRPIYFHVPPHSKIFSGRAEKLLQMKQLCKQGSTTIVRQSVLGLGGIGKSELAKKFISSFVESNNESQKDSEIVSLIWLNAENENALSQDFRTLAKDELRISTKDAANGEKDIRTVVKEVYNFFEDKNCIFIYDNAENSSCLFEYLPISHQFNSRESIKPSILITSRDREWNIDSQVVIDLDVLKIDEAVEFVRRGLRLDYTPNTESNSDKHIQDLIHRLGFFPLALNQAISYIQQQMHFNQTYGVLNYINELEDHTKHFFNYNICTHTQTTYNTWKVTISRIGKDQAYGKEAIQILHLLAYFSPEGIFVSFFKKLVTCSIKLRQAVLLLNKYSMIKLKPETAQNKAQISIHRLVQEVIRIELKYLEEDKDYLLLAFKLIKDDVNTQSVSHLITMWNHAKSCVDVVKIHRDVPEKIVSCLLKHFRLSEAYNLAVNEIKFLESFLQQDTSVNLGRLEGLIGQILYSQWKYKDALDRLNSALQKVKLVKNSPSFLIIKLRHQICKTKLELREINEPRKIYLEIINDCLLNENERSPTDNLIFAKCLQDYGNWLYNMEFYEEALKYMNECEILFVRYSEHNNIQVVITQLWRDLILCFLKRYTKPARYLIELYKRDIALPGLHTVETFRVAQDILCYLFYVEGNVDDSYPFCKELYESKVKLYGKDNVNSIHTAITYSTILREKKLFNKALENSMQCLAICKQQAYKKIVTLMVRQGIACAQIGLGKLDEAYTILLQLMPELKHPHPRDSFAVFRIKLDMVLLLEMREQYGEAYKLLVEAKNDLDTVLAATTYPVYQKKIFDAMRRLEHSVLKC